MANKVVIFPVGKQAEAQAYSDWTTVQWQALYEPTGTWGYVRNDAYGQWVVPYLGPPMTWDGVIVPEPEGGEAARADGVLHDTVTWPNEDE